MEVRFDISRPIMPQAARDFQLMEKNGEYAMNPSVGSEALIRRLLLPGELEFYHFGKTVYQVPVEMTSVNPAGSEWFLIHVNLSSVQQNKRVGDELIEFHKYRPAGILLYGPDLEINTFFPRGTEAEVCGIRFSRSLLAEYLPGEWTGITGLDSPLTYEDLDPELENMLMDALSVMDDLLQVHASVLLFLRAFLRKLQKHAPGAGASKLYTKDYKQLMKAAAALRNPGADRAPTLEELSVGAGMSITKFKTTFKQVFGCPPLQYRNKVRLEYAREQLRKRRRTPAELAYELGYAHPSNFTAAYKRYFHTLPSEEAR